MSGTLDITYQYPPELFNLLVDAIPRLFRSKRDVVIFFKGAGIKNSLISDVESTVNTNRDAITKYEITRTILIRINEKGEAGLRERREILKRITEFDDYSTCWESDRLVAKGLVAEIRRVINIKDSFTRINKERQMERQKRMSRKENDIKQIKKRQEEISAVKNELFGLFSEKDVHKRGKELEKVLNRLFKVYGILINEAFSLRDKESGITLEQIDGVVEFEGNHYLVEMKWWDKPIGKAEVSNHLVNIYHRGQSRGILISATGFTDAAIAICKEALLKTTIILCTLREVSILLEKGDDLKIFLKKKINAAFTNKDPFLHID